MAEIKLPYLIIYLLSIFLSSISQVLLKKAALKEHKNFISEYTDLRVIGGYFLFIMCTFLTMIAYKGVPLNFGPVIEATGYIYITFFGVVIFKEKLNFRKMISLFLVVIGIIIFAM